MSQISRIVTVSAREHFQTVISNLSKLAIPLGNKTYPYPVSQAKQLASTSLWLHRCHLREALRKAKDLITGFDEREDIVVIQLKQPIPEEKLQLFIGTETLGVLNDWKIEKDTLIITEYLAIGVLEALALASKIGALAVMDTVTDDESWNQHFLLQDGDKFYVLKRCDHGGNWVHLYNNLSDAIVDYQTIDYGWEGWSELQAQELKVKPLKHQTLKYFTSLFLQHYKPSQLIDCQCVYQLDEEWDRAYKALAGRVIKGWIFDEFGAMAPKSSPSFKTLKPMLDRHPSVKKRREKDRREKERYKRIWQLERKINELKNKAVETFTGYNFKVVARDETGKIILFSSPPPSREQVLVEESVERTSKKGKAYIKCFRWQLLKEVIKPLQEELEELRKMDEK